MSEDKKGYRILLTMFEMVKAETHGTDRKCFNQIVRFLADCARVHPMPKEDHKVADRLLPMIKALVDAWYKEPYDYLGQLFSEKDCAIDEMGQLITPPWIVSYINDSVLQGLEEEEEKERWKRVLDPATGTGRFLLDLALRYRDKKVALFGCELDLDLYRACLVNMRLFALGMPYFILRADALIVNLKPGSSNWRFANLWSPPDWRTKMVTPEGETFSQWSEEHGFEEAPQRRTKPERRPKVEKIDDLPLFGREGENE